MIHRTESVPVVVVGGYLGSGKTTLINELLLNASRKIAVIVNDFGSVNIDASLIASLNSDTIELTNGCVCCALGGTLADTMLDISDREVLPELVVIEASGVSDPSSVAANAYIGGFHLAATVVLVDAVNAAHTSQNALVGQTFNRQLNSAHLLVITKRDAATAEQHSSCLHIASTAGAPIIDRSDFSLESLVDVSPAHIASSFSVGHDGHFSSEMLELPELHSVHQLETLLSELPKNAVRAKGIVQVGSENLLVQRVGAHTAITSSSLSPTGIVVIYAD